MLVRATEACFIGGQRRKPGAKFEFNGDVLPSHLVPVKTGDVEAVAEVQQPIALSEMAAAKSRSFVEAVSKKK